MHRIRNSHCSHNNIDIIWLLSFSAFLIEYNDALETLICNGMAYSSRLLSSKLVREMQMLIDEKSTKRVTPNNGLFVLFYLTYFIPLD